MKKAFTLVEMLIVIVILATLMGLVFRLGSMGTNSDKRIKTIFRLQCLENCLSGYYAAFGSYPPVKLHASQDIYLSANDGGEQEQVQTSNLFEWRNIGDRAEQVAWMQVRNACKAQPVDAAFPFPAGYREIIENVCEEMNEKLDDLEENERPPDSIIEKIRAKFDDGGSEHGTGRFSSNKDKTEWDEIKLFKFGLLSYILPRYLFMMNGAKDFYDGSFSQWESNNVTPSDPFSGSRFTSWQTMKDYAESDQKSELARLANIPSQAVCARWMPNLANACSANRQFTFFGIDVVDDVRPKLNPDNFWMDIYSPDNGESTKDQYVLDGITIFDGWGNEFYYYSPPPYQKYTIWSAGPNGRTFPPWVQRKNLPKRANECVGKWVDDDIIHMSN